MSEIVRVLMKRDGLSREDAVARLEEAREQANAVISDPSLSAWWPMNLASNPITSWSCYDLCQCH